MLVQSGRHSLGGALVDGVADRSRPSCPASKQTQLNTGNAGQRRPPLRGTRLLFPARDAGTSEVAPGATFSLVIATRAALSSIAVAHHHSDPVGLFRLVCVGLAALGCACGCSRTTPQAPQSPSSNGSASASANIGTPSSLALAGTAPAPLVLATGATVASGPIHAHRLAIGDVHVCALDEQGRVACWGDNSALQLGVVGAQRIGSPTLVQSLAKATSVAVSNGAKQPASCAAMADGTVRCWGGVGKYPSAQAAAPHLVPGVVRTRSIAMARDFACAGNDQGRVTCWGCGCQSCPLEPQAPAGLTDVVELSGGTHHICGRHASGRVSCINARHGCWDPNSQQSQLSEPIELDGIDDAIDVSVGNTTVCAVRRTGEVLCWRLQTPSSSGAASNSGPPKPIEGVTGALRIAVGEGHGCAIDSLGYTLCWGRSYSGQLGRAARLTGSMPPGPAKVRGAVEIVAGRDTTCARLDTGRVACFGDNDHGIVGQGTVGTSATPQPVAGISHAVQVALGEWSSCALTDAGEVYCWGWGAPERQIAQQPHQERAITPERVLGLSKVTRVVGGGYSTCAIEQSGSVGCWESGVFPLQYLPIEPGVPGYATRIPGLNNVAYITLPFDTMAAVTRDGRVFFSPVKEPTRPATAINELTGLTVVGLGLDWICGINRQSEVSCWPYRNGQLRPGPRNTVRAASGALSLPRDSVALLKNGQVVDWYFERTPSTARPIEGRREARGLVVGSHFTAQNVVEFAENTGLSCGRDRGGRVFCSGNNYYGQLGIGRYDPGEAKGFVEGLTDAISISVGREHACAARLNGSVVCWGSNSHDQLGIEARAQYFEPVEVVGFP
jgi:alpha-tubulin suppressor-like RCC1 family protein